MILCLVEGVTVWLRKRIDLYSSGAPSYLLEGRALFTLEIELYAHALQRSKYTKSKVVKFLYLALLYRDLSAQARVTVL